MKEVGEKLLQKDKRNLEAAKSVCEKSLCSLEGSDKKVVLKCIAHINKAIGVIEHAPLSIKLSKFKVRLNNWIASDSSNFVLWYLKSFLGGFKTIYVVFFIISVCFLSELPFWRDVFLRTRFDFQNIALLKPLAFALPALVGPALLDYFITEPRPRSVSWAALLAFFILAIGGIIAFLQQSLVALYFVTAGVMVLVWCVKGRDKCYVVDPEHDPSNRDVSAAAGGSLNTKLNGAGVTHGLTLER